MKFVEFKSRFQNYPFLSSYEIVRFVDDPQVMRNQLTRWQKKGLLVPLKKGLYLLNKEDRKINPTEPVIANKIYEPSYISLEYALMLYGLIPEQVLDITSVTTRKTQTFRNDLGTFIYQHIKVPAFRGFKRIGNQHKAFLLADVEKALVDLFYLKLSVFKSLNSKQEMADVFEQFFRLQNVEDLSKDKLMKMGILFKSKKLLTVLNHFFYWMDNA